MSDDQIIRAHGPEMAAVRKVLYSLGECDSDDGQTLLDAAEATLERVEALEARVADLEETVDVVDATMPRQQRGKIERVRQILAYGTTQATGGPKGVTIETGEAAAAADASRDTARRLMDEIGANFPWAATENPGGPNPKVLKLDAGTADLTDLMDDVRDRYREDAQA